MKNRGNEQLGIERKGPASAEKRKYLDVALATADPIATKKRKIKFM